VKNVFSNASRSIPAALGVLGWIAFGIGFFTVKPVWLKFCCMLAARVLPYTAFLFCIFSPMSCHEASYPSLGHIG